MQTTSAPLRTVRSRFVLLAITLLAQPGCGGDDIATRYFPLSEGYQWQYRVKRTTMDGVRDLRYIIATAAPARLEEVGPEPAAVRETHDGQRFYYAATPAGIERVATRRREGGRFVTVADRALILPYPLDAAATWTGPSRTAVLENTGPPWETLFRISVPLAMAYRIDKLDATVETPAGTFTDCVVVSGVGKVNADVGNYIGRTDIAVTTTEWFAPGVGLVRLERTESTTASALDFGSLTMELDRWQED